MIPQNVLRTSQIPYKMGSFPRDAYACAVKELDALPLRTIGAHLERVPAGKRSCVLHHHLLEEEVFYVISGHLRVRELPAESSDLRTYDLFAGDLVAFAPGTWLAHQFEAVEDTEFLALSTREPGDVCVYPDSGKVLLKGTNTVGVWAAHEPMLDAVRDAAKHRPCVAASDRPSHAVHGADVPLTALGDHVSGRPLARIAGAKAVLLNEDHLAPGGCTSPLHWHRFEEELIVVIEGHPSLRQERDGVIEQVALTPGDVVHFAPNDRVAHQFINASNTDAVLAVIGTHVAHEIVYFTETNRTFSRLMGHVGEIIERPYWDGE